VGDALMLAAIGHNNSPMDFGDFFDLVTDSPASAHEKLVKLVIARLAQKAGGKVAPRRVEILYKASCSEATFKRSFSSLKEFFDINPKKGHKTEYTPKRQLTAYDVEAAARAVCEKTRDHSDTYSEKKASELRVSEIPTSEPSPVQEVKTRDHSDTHLKKEIPPTPPKEKNNITTLDWRERKNLDLLETKLLDACNGAAANPAASPNIMVLSEPIKWLEGGCDLDLDILPTIRARAHKLRPGSVKNWSYFTQAVADAKASREAPMPEGNARHPASGGWRDEEADRRKKLRDALEKVKAEYNG
jgi:hypothetical protein